MNNNQWYCIECEVIHEGLCPRYTAVASSPSAAPVQHETGGKRSEVAPYYAAIPYLSLRRVALRATGAPEGSVRNDPATGHTYEGGSDKYGYDNWQRGLPLEDTVNHIIQHLLAWKDAVSKGVALEDDDLAAAAWGIMLPLMTFEHEYIEQARTRSMYVASGDAVEDIDAMMRRTFGKYLLQPLSPKKG